MDQATTRLSTERSSHGIEAYQSRMPPIPTLTILCHPSLRRIGDHALLKELLVFGRDVKLARLTPCFMPPRQHHGKHLDDTRVSRQPLRLRRAADGGIDIFRDESRTRIAVDGADLGEHAHVPPQALQRGVLLELASCILLLLHEHTPPEEPETGDLGLVGESTAIARVRADIRRVADLDVTALIRGQTGTGKELVAQAIHDQSPRRKRDMVSINISAIPPSLAAAEMFGASRGAYTGATGQDGYFRRAHGSTLFLDEIGEAPLDIQTMLLRVLETKQIQGLGMRCTEPIDVRVLAATDAFLERRVQEGRFSEPLFYRLSSYEIEVPPLRERRDDIGRLLLHFLGLELAEVGEAERLDQIEPAPWLPMHVVAHLVRHDWPGNVRELRQAVRKLVIANRGRTVAEMPPLLGRRLDASNQKRADIATGHDVPDSAPPHMPPPRRPAEISDDEIRETLRMHHCEVKAAADALGMSRNTLYDRIRSSEIMRTAKDVSMDEICQARDECCDDLDAMADRLGISKGGLLLRMKKLGLA